MKRRLRRHQNYHRSIKMHLLRQSTVCGICRKPIEDLAQATLDHIVPLCRGGSDGLKNLQVAHEFCNVLKADQVIGMGTGG